MRFWMKKKIAIGLTALLLGGLVQQAIVQANETSYVPSAKAAIMLDADSGTILFEKSSHRELPPASITKMMSMLLVIEAIHKKQLSWDEKVTASEYAASMGGSQIFLEPGEKMTVKDLFKGLVIASGNDATVALAERVGGSEKQFVQMMNAKARQLNLKNTHFSNTNGLPIANHYTSAYDIAMIGRALLKYPEILTFTGTYEDYLRKDTKNPFWLVNSNKLLRFYKGADGLKTGYTSEAGSCLAATAKHGELRLIAVVLGEPSAKVRNAEISDLLDYGFSQFVTKTVVKKGSLLGTIRIKDGTPAKLKIKADKAISVLVGRNQAAGSTFKTTVTWNKSIAAPLKKGTKIGSLHVMQGSKTVKIETIYAPKSVKRSGFFDNLKQVIYSITMSK